MFLTDRVVRSLLIFPFIFLLSCSETVVPEKNSPKVTVLEEQSEPVDDNLTNKEMSLKPLLGIQFSKEGPIKDIPEISGEMTVKVTRVIKNSSADEAGIRPGDLIHTYDGKSFNGLNENKVTSTFRNYIKDHKQIGDLLKLRVYRKSTYMSGRYDDERFESENYDTGKIGNWLNQLNMGQPITVNIYKERQVLDVDVVLKGSDYFLNAAPNENARLYPQWHKYNDGYLNLINKIASAFDLDEQLTDLMGRYDEDEWWDGGFRLNVVRFLHRDPSKILHVSDEITENLLNSAKPNQDLFSYYDGVRELLDENPGDRAVFIFKKPTSNRFEDHLEYLQKIISQAHDHRYLAFRKISDEDLDFLYSHGQMILDQSLSVSWNNQDTGKFDDFDRVLNLVKQVDFYHLMRGMQVLSQLSDKQWLRRFEMSARAYKKKVDLQIKTPNDKRGRLLLIEDWEHGKFILGDVSRNTFESGAPFVVDLGGDDFYLNRQAAAFSKDQPISVVIDFSGDDYYSATEGFSQGAGFLGYGVLIDVKGNDTYLSSKRAQGVGLIGGGLLWDGAGDDTYRGQEYMQGFGMWGSGTLIDVSGADRYQGALYTQGVSSAKGVGALIDLAGNDRYIANGKYRSSYGTQGIFSGSSQGFSIGVRGYTSGGVGLLLDAAGNDRFEAGNFSQGGGYYFGLGILRNFGIGRDRYQGSRYAQGFSAHSAIGVLIDDGGNDFYQTRVGAAQSAAWDLGAAGLWDKSGNDTYDCEFLSFCQGAAAHNGFSLFRDQQGSDTYLMRPGQRAAVPSNSYHDGNSFAFFLDEGPGIDTYDGQKVSKTIGARQNDYGFFLDLAQRLSENIKREQIIKWFE